MGFCSRRLVLGDLIDGLVLLLGNNHPNPISWHDTLLIGNRAVFGFPAKLSWYARNSRKGIHHIQVLCNWVLCMCDQIINLNHTYIIAIYIFSHIEFAIKCYIYYVWPSPMFHSHMVPACLWHVYAHMRAHWVLSPCMVSRHIKGNVLHGVVDQVQPGPKGGWKQRL